MNPIDLILVASQFLTKNQRLASKKILVETARREREDRQIKLLIQEQERARRRRINGL
jgi:hypothetical protein